MKPTSSLFAKILFWFFLNLFLVTAVLAVFFAFQQQVNLHAIFGQQGSNRLRTAGMLIAHDLSESLPSDWPGVLTRHAAIHRVDFMLVLQDGSTFSSTKANLPKAVRKRVKRVLQRKPPKGPFPPPHGLNEPPRMQERVDDAPGGELRQKAVGGSPPIPLDESRKKPKLMMRTQQPTRYWSGIRIHLPLAPMRRPEPAMLLAVSDSVTGNGFFFDPLPWMVVASVVILISVLLWIPMVRSITRPLTRMTRATEDIANGRFDVSIYEPRADEIGRLAKTINHMTSRLSAFVNGQKRFLGDVAHELGSPIARIQFGLGALEQRVKEENRQRVADVMDDVEHLSKLVSELLAFSRADLKSDTAKLEKVDLLSIAQLAVKRESTPEVEISVQINPQTRVVASAELLTRALANLVRNAVKYAGDKGPIEITAAERKDVVDIIVRDSGLGVPEDQLDQLFEPFFRLEPSRDRDSGGVGLGLAIVKTCVETCKGTISAANINPGGFAVTITLGTRV